MMAPKIKPNAMGANRAGEHTTKQTAIGMETSRDMANRVTELTEQVAALLQRVDDLEGRG